MEIVRTPEEMQQRALGLKREGRVMGLVPTMGFLHDGHMELVRMARKRCDVLVVSIFVNPTQFGPNEDLDAYPRDFDQDERRCAAAGVDFIFYPTAENMYAADQSLWVDEFVLSKGLCGGSRAGHFRGVCTVVAKLFNVVQPDLAVFGEKDAQQLRIIERMVRDLNFPITILRGALVREADGLAMSSRNKYLSDVERKQALCLRQSLDEVLELFKAGERSVEVLQTAIRNRIQAEDSVEIDYVEFVDDVSLAQVEAVNQDTLVALAIKVGRTRLIDNDVLHV
jgi:pantoate--beta-alanine ligase